MVWKKIIASIIVIAIVLVGVYFLFISGGGNSRSGGLAAPGPRTIVTLAVWGGSAFITGFGLRDVIGRVMATRQRDRLKATQQVDH